MHFNPTFGHGSELVGGADADLICGGMLVDIKTTGSNKITSDYLDQLVGYYFLARYMRSQVVEFPEINSLAIYFSRHGHLQIYPVDYWLNHCQFTEVETWFFERASMLN